MGRQLSKASFDSQSMPLKLIFIAFIRLMTIALSTSSRIADFFYC